MTALDFHLLLNHIPIVGLFFVILFLVYGTVIKSDAVQRGAWMAIILISFLTIPAFLTGEPAEEIVEDTYEVSHDVIHEHEEAAELAVIFMDVLGILAIVTLVLSLRNKLPTWLKYVLLVFAIVVFAMMANVGSLGGDIMRTGTGI